MFSIYITSQRDRATIRQEWMCSTTGFTVTDMKTRKLDHYSKANDCEVHQNNWQNCCVYACTIWVSPFQQPLAPDGVSLRPRDDRKRDWDKQRLSPEIHLGQNGFLYVCIHNYDSANVKLNWALTTTERVFLCWLANQHVTYQKYDALKGMNSIHYLRVAHNIFSTIMLHC